MSPLISLSKLCRSDASFPPSPRPAARFKAKSFTIDGDAVVIGPDGLAQFGEAPPMGERPDYKPLCVRPRRARRRGSSRPFLERKSALARLLRGTDAGLLLNEHIAEAGPTVFAHAFRLGAEGMMAVSVESAYAHQLCPNSGYILHRRK
jgi:hypothetical protein